MISVDLGVDVLFVDFATPSMVGIYAIKRCFEFCRRMGALNDSLIRYTDSSAVAHPRVL